MPPIKAHLVDLTDTDTLVHITLNPERDPLDPENPQPLRRQPNVRNILRSHTPAEEHKITRVCHWNRSQ